MSERPNVLILCTGNSCRSQIAEGYFRRLAGDRFNAYSAGTAPAERVHPVAVQVMAEDGVDLSAGRPKHLKEFLGALPVRYLITVCGAADQSCPGTWPALDSRLHWPFDDPAAFQGSEAETLHEFRRVRDQIKHQITSWLATDPQ